MPRSTTIHTTEDWFQSDHSFNLLYPPEIRALARRHWTPLKIAFKIAGFLAVENGARILDIGSGVGKFCLAGAWLKPAVHFFGVEQRMNLVTQAESTRKQLQLRNVSFIHGNFTQLDFSRYDHFYFYNAFYENLAGTQKIDDAIDYSTELYHYYTSYLFNQLHKKPAGTRLVTYHSLEDEIPPGFQVVATELNNMMKCWIKI